MKGLLSKLKKAAISLIAGAVCLAMPITAYAAKTTEQSGEVIEITEYFNDGIMFTMSEAYDSDASEDDIVPLATGTIASTYWGAYNSDDGEYYLQINNSTSIGFRGQTSDGYVFCNHGKVQNVYFDPNRTIGTNFSVTYSEYTRLIKNNDGTTSSKLMQEAITIFGKYNKSDKTFTIYYITYYRQ